jgi:hypothetical protein
MPIKMAENARGEAFEPLQTPHVSSVMSMEIVSRLEVLAFKTKYRKARKESFQYRSKNQF